MRISNGWLLIEDRDRINLSLNCTSIIEVKKHFLEKQNRSFLHYDDDCAFCKEGYPVRQRYVAQVLVDNNNLQWEFGPDVRRQLSMLEQFSDASGFIRLQVRREGKGRTTYYRCIYRKTLRFGANYGALNISIEDWEKQRMSRD